MTAIAGIEYGGTVFIGADSQASSSYEKATRADAKVFVRGPYIIGFTTSYRMGQLLQYAGTLPIPPTSPNALHGFMVCDFMEAARSIFKDGGFLKITNGEETGGAFLVGVRGRLFHVESDGQVGRNRAGFDAAGTGAQVILGALHESRTRTDAPERIRSALRAAEAWAPGVGAPFVIKAGGARD